MPRLPRKDHGEGRIERVSEFLPPRTVQIVGLLSLIAIGVFWGVTGRLDPLLLATAASLVTGGNIAELYLRIKTKPPAA